jgi:hypothetical protein
MTKLNTLFSIGLVFGLAACAEEPAPAPLQSVPASADTTAATGVARWDVYMKEGTIELRGIAADERAIVTNAIQPTANGDVVITFDGLAEGQLALAADGEVLASELDASDPALIGAMQRDLEDAEAAYGVWDCIKLAAYSVAAGAACGAAVFELGLNPVADAACIVAFSEANDLACSGKCSGSEGFGCDAQ